MLNTSRSRPGLGSCAEMLPRFSGQEAGNGGGNPGGGNAGRGNGGKATLARPTLAGATVAGANPGGNPAGRRQVQMDVSAAHLAIGYLGYC